MNGMYVCQNYAGDWILNERSRLFLTKVSTKKLGIPEYRRWINNNGTKRF